MTRGQSCSRRAAAAGLAVAVVLIVASSPAAAVAPSNDPVAGAKPAAVAPPAPVVASVASVSPIAPPPVATDTMVNIVVSVTNNTAASLQHLSIEAVRDQPLVHQSSVDGMLAHPALPTSDDLTEPLPTATYPVSIDAHGTLQLTYRVPASTNRHPGALCLCQDGIYPVDLSVYGASGSASIARVAWTQTYLISLTNSPAPVQVSWLWPLIDRPHRLTDDNVFLDDSLAGEVEPGGRLDRALQVLEQLGKASKVTVVIDPELIDELSVMSTGYRVEKGRATAAGTGGPAASAWLDRLRAVIGNFDVSLTPYDDPAINAVAQAGLTWADTLPADMQQRVEEALGELPGSVLAWPPGETVTPAALQQLVQDGTTTVVVNDTTLPGGSTANPPLDAIASIPAGASSVRALVTSKALQARVSDLLASSGSLGGLPALMAELAIRTVDNPQRSSYVVFTPDRYVDTDPTAAATVITTTTQSAFTAAISALDAANTIIPANRGSLTPPAAGSISAPLVGRAVSTIEFVRQFSSVIGPAQVATLLGGYAGSIQASESAGWSNDPAAAADFSARLGDESAALDGGVRIVRPSKGSYSLASSSAPLLVTVQNTLTVPVTVRVQLTSARGVAGFRADTVTQTIAANSRRTIKVQAHVSRSGRFRVDAALMTPAGGALGEPLELTIYSSALGTIGVVITVVALAVLIIALVNRFVRRWRHHRALIRMMTAEPPIPAGARG